MELKIYGKGPSGVLTLPDENPPTPAVVLLHGSDRSGKEDPYYKNHAQHLAKAGVAVLRYDGPGWGGQSATMSGFETFDSRKAEVVSVIQFLQSRPEIKPNAIGLWGISQGGWICQMAAAEAEQVAFIISVSGPGVSPGEQEVYRVEAESRAAGFKEIEIAKAILMRRLMVDIVIPEPRYQHENQMLANQLEDGPWNAVMELVYGSKPLDPVLEFQKVRKLLEEIIGETWTKYLHLDQVTPIFENLQPETWPEIKKQLSMVMDVDPGDFLTKVRCPLLAIFGEADRSVPVEKSISNYKKFLKEAGNEQFSIAVFPSADHTIRAGEEHAAGYFDLMINWLKTLNM